VVVSTAARLTSDEMAGVESIARAMALANLSASTAEELAARAGRIASTILQRRYS
jgi:hypothetical protein